jgi:hypothetical protein
MTPMKLPFTPATAVVFFSALAAVYGDVTPYVLHYDNGAADKFVMGLNLGQTTATSPSNWAVQAGANLTAWRNALFVNTMNVRSLPGVLSRSQPAIGAGQLCGSYPWALI